MATVTRPPARRLLLTSQRNEFYALIGAHGLSPAKFSWVEATRTLFQSRYLISRLVYSGTEYHFDSDPQGDEIWKWSISPGNNEPHAAGQGNWHVVIDAFRAWLGFLVREVDAPDLWSGDIVAGIEIESADEWQNDALTDAEVRAVEKRIAGVRGYLLEAGLPAEQLAKANGKLDYLVTAAKRVGRFDWRNLAVGVMVDIAINATFNPQQAQTLWNLLVGPARHLLGA